MLVVFLDTRMPRETVRTTWDEVERCTEDLTLNEHPLQCRKWIHRLTWKAWTVQRPVLRWKLRIPCPRLSRWKIVAQLSTSSRVPWLQVWKQMHSWLSLLVSTWWWEETQGEAEKKVLKDQLLFWEGKRPRLCIRRFWSKEFYSTESWRIGIWTLRRDTPEILRMHLVQSWIFEKKGNLVTLSKEGEPRERNPCALDFVDQPPKETPLREDFLEV